MWKFLFINVREKYEKAKSLDLFTKWGKRKVGFTHKIV